MFYVEYKLGNQWYRFQSHGKDVVCQSEQEANEYIRYVAGECRVVPVVDQEIRFAEGQFVEISTQTGWVPALVEKIIDWPEGYAYKVSYIPTWSKEIGFTAVTGLAVRELA